ncbi:MAG: exodeoxyribonuclease III [Patescibacteria group bacterium]
MKLLSWNVNGLRAVEKKGAFKFLTAGDYDIVALQETKISTDTKLPEHLISLKGYEAFWDYSSEKKGYSGVVIYTKIKPEKVTKDFGKYDLLTKEGRLIQLSFSNFEFFNIYFPNGKARQERLDYKMKFYEQFKSYLKDLLKQDKAIIFCGDVNTAHQEIDLARPKENEKISGFLPEERAWLDEIVNLGFVDSFRMFNKKGENYSWWDQKTHARERNIGWRIDYFFVNSSLVSKVKEANILNEIMGSDHCPVTLEISIT